MPGVPVAQGRHTTRYRGAFAGQHTSQPLVAVEDLADVFGRVCLNHGPVVVAVALGAVAGAQSLPGLGGSLASSEVAAKRPAGVVTRWLEATATA